MTLNVGKIVLAFLGLAVAVLSLAFIIWLWEHRLAEAHFANEVAPKTSPREQNEFEAGLLVKEKSRVQRATLEGSGSTPVSIDRAMQWMVEKQTLEVPK